MRITADVFEDGNASSGDADFASYTCVRILIGLSLPASVGGTLVPGLHSFGSNDCLAWQRPRNRELLVWHRGGERSRRPGTIAPGLSIFDGGLADLGAEATGKISDLVEPQAGGYLPDGLIGVTEQPASLFGSHAMEILHDAHPHPTRETPRKMPGAQMNALGQHVQRDRLGKVALQMAGDVKHSLMRTIRKPMICAILDAIILVQAGNGDQYLQQRGAGGVLPAVGFCPLLGHDRFQTLANEHGNCGGGVQDSWRRPSRIARALAEHFEGPTHVPEERRESLHHATVDQAVDNVEPARLEIGMPDLRADDDDVAGAELLYSADSLVVHGARLDIDEFVEHVVVRVNLRMTRNPRDVHAGIARFAKVPPGQRPKGPVGDGRGV